MEREHKGLQFDVCHVIKRCAFRRKMLVPISRAVQFVLSDLGVCDLCKVRVNLIYCKNSLLKNEVQS